MNRRGACPSLHAPMPTGDGLLVRLGLRKGLSPPSLKAIAEAAGRFGNGWIEVTARGNLQIRGLTADNAPQFAEQIETLDLAMQGGVAVETGPLAGVDGQEIADPRPLVLRITAAIESADLAPHLGPKVSVIVDGSGLLRLDEIMADIRFSALPGEPAGQWLVSTGGTAATATSHGVVDGDEAVAAAMSILALLAERGVKARTRDIKQEDIRSCFNSIPAGMKAPLAARASRPVGFLPLSGDHFAVGLGLPFGQATHQQLSILADQASRLGLAEFRLAPDRALIALGSSDEALKQLQADAEALGFITDPHDPRLAIITCAGSVGCASGRIETKAIAAEIAASRIFDTAFRLHISGCEKHCAGAVVSGLTLTGANTGCDLTQRLRDKSVLLATVPETQAAETIRRFAALNHVRNGSIGATTDFIPDSAAASVAPTIR